MSQAQQAMTKEAAAAVMDQVWIDSFIDKLASIGLPPRDENEAQRMVEIAMAIKQAEFAENQKRAAESGSLVERAHAALLQKTAANSGVDQVAVQHLASAFAQTPIVRQAAELFLQA